MGRFTGTATPARSLWLLSVLDTTVIETRSAIRKRIVMGYCMSQRGGDFAIPVKSHKQALESLKSIMANTSDMSGSSGGVRHFGFCNGADAANWSNLAQAMEEMRWCPKQDADYNIVGLEFQGEKMGDDIKIFEAIAEFVKEGSFIEMHGEDGDQWRWVFRENKVMEIKADVSWSE